MQVDWSNPVVRDHPLNRNRVAWWLTPHNSPRLRLYPVSINNRPYPDLLGTYDATVVNGTTGSPDWTMHGRFPAVTWTVGGNLDGLIDCTNASAFDLTDNFTVGCSFTTGTLTPATGGRGGLMSKYQNPSANSWYIRQYNQTVEFGGSSQISSGNVLAVGVEYRMIATVSGGTGTIWLNGTQVATGAVAVSSSSDPVYIGMDYFDGGGTVRAWNGRIWDAFISSRPWTVGDVQQDWQLQANGYFANNSPLRFIKNRTYFTGTAPADFTTGIGVANTLQNVSPVRFTTGISASASASGIGPVVPTGPAEFDTQMTVRSQASIGVPTLVNFTTGIGVANTGAVSNPVSFETAVGIRTPFTAIPNGDRRILAQRHYRR